MSLIVLEHGSLSFGSQRILDDASLRIGEKERIGLVGPNGAGKTTLLKVLMGELALDGGSLQHARSLAIGYLPQDVQELTGGTVLGSVLATVPGRNLIRARLEEAEAALCASTDPDEQLRLAERLGDLADELEHFETWFSELRARSILLGLGFRSGELERPLGELSGGWKMRCALAGLLFQQPDVLFLDEPTNHLDLPSVLWLDRFLDQLRSSVVLISHDREFLNRHVERMLSFEPEGLRSYTGNYVAYLAQRTVEE
ncbi:MAG: ABC-F family ATP-binding cassette domain-containing protein, partial [Deltaproteobacteria bacterium]|nr:ABC-F family ATP-binding cassette domain-containing protein [Deltaproteobacteria bacterium]